ncbi:MAG: hypothetical protein ABIF17_04670 [Patescibacteria group bacterium]
MIERDENFFNNSSKGEEFIKKNLIKEVSELSPEARIKFPEEYRQLLDRERIKGKWSFDTAEAIVALQKLYGYKSLFDIEGLRVPELDLDQSLSDNYHLLKYKDKSNWLYLNHEIIRKDEFLRFQAGIENQLKLGKGKVNVLEIGAGTSYFQDPHGHYLEPRYSRAMQVLYEDKVDITSTDIMPDKVDEGFFIISVNENGHLFCEGMDHLKKNEIGQGDKVFDFHSQASGVYRHPKDGYKFIPISLEYIELLKQNKLFDEPVSSSYSKLYIRPMVDPLFEKLVYGLNFRGGVNMFKLRENFPEKKFDFIFASMLEPWIEESWQGKIEDISNMLADKGHLSVHIDKEDGLIEIRK